MKSKIRYFIKVRKKSGEYPQTKGYSPDFSPRRSEGVAKSSNLVILQHPLRILLGKTGSAQSAF